MNVTVFNLFFLIAAVGFVAYFLTRKQTSAPTTLPVDPQPDELASSEQVGSYPEEVTVIDYAPE